MKNELGYGRDSKLVFTNTHKECSSCREIKEHSEFHKDSSNKYGLAYYCKLCACARGSLHHARRMKEDPEYQIAMKTRYKKRMYGLTHHEYIEKLKAQNNLCAICGVELPMGGHLTHLDHCHTTGMIRAFLCTNCNRGLGHFKDSVINLHKAIVYLESHNQNVDLIKEEILCELS